MRTTLVLALTVMVATGAVAQAPPAPAPAAPAAPVPKAPPAAPAASSIPPDFEQAAGVLAKSPRHGEWVDVAMPDGPKLSTWVVFPERKEKAGIVIIIHEIFGLSDWVRGVADRLAADGFIAVAPDLLSGMGPNGGGTASLGDTVTSEIRKLTPEQVVARLDAVRTYALALPAANGKLGVVGFCWGGAASFNYATAQPKLDAAVVYYGTSPSDPQAYARISAPVLGNYGSDDARVNATIPVAEEQMKKLAKSYTANVYDAAGHGFLRQQTGREGANLKAAQQAWPATITFFRERLN